MLQSAMNGKKNSSQGRKSSEKKMTAMSKITLQGTNISLKNGILKMIFLFPRWDMLIPWRVYDSTRYPVLTLELPWPQRTEGDKSLESGALKIAKRSL